MRKIIIAVLIALLPTLAAAQMPNLPSGTVWGRTQVGTGPGQAVPFATLIATMLESTLTIPTINTSSILFAGSTSGTATVSAQAVAGTPALKWPTVSGTIPSSVASPLVQDPVTGAVSCPTCATSVSAASPVLVSRAVAQTLNLSGLTALKTLSYAGAVGGGATFKNVGSAVFIDTFIDQVTTPPTRVGGSGYVNATYNHVFLTGSATGKFCPVTIIVSGGAVSSVSMPVPCVGFAVGDVLTTANSNLGGSGSGFTWTVNAVIGPMASFTDSVGTHFQYVVDPGSYIDPLQFGAVYNWTFAGGDAGATNDRVSNQSAIAFASYNATSVEAPNAGTQGNVVLLPKGISLNCGFGVTNAQTLIVPEGVRILGRGVDVSAWKECSATTTTNFIGLCNPASTFGEYGCALERMQLLSDVAGAGSGTALVYSNSGQQFPLLDTIELNPASRGCVKYDIGRGGAANAIFLHVDCEQGAFSGTPTNHGMVFPSTLGGTQVHIHSFVYGCGTAACTTANVDAIQLQGGDLVMDGINNIEGAGVGISLLTTSASVQHSIKNVTYTANSGQTGSVIQLLATNHAGNTLFENIQPGNATKTISNGQSGGTDFTGAILKAITCVSGACS